MSKFNDLVAKLREIFQIDRPDLDFGIYRIINARADEINEYLEKRLKEKVEAALASGSAASIEQLQSELTEAEKKAQELGMPVDDIPKVRELKAKIKEAMSGSAEHENAVFSHLLTFFSRYYDNGDFISQRRYKGDTYAIPYAGEEVMLHWANKDQYYIKSGENFSNYSFKLDDGRIVHFRLVAADTAKDNRKDNDKERRFVLAEHKTVIRMDEEGEEYDDEILPVETITVKDPRGNESEELVIRFEYKAMPKGSKQGKLVDEAVKAILANSDVNTHWVDLSKRAPTENNPKRTSLEKQLNNYTSKNSSDYFIHQNLGEFLKQELDFYIKNEVMNLDDIQHANSVGNIEKNLRVIQCLRSIACDLINFLAQIEKFQKKLWIKKKLVCESNYVFSLDKASISDEKLKIILSNSSQRKEWETIFNADIKDIDKHTKNSGAKWILNHSDYKHLSIDTSYFSSEQKFSILKDIDLDIVDGLLVHGENYQALEFISKRYREKVSTIYIDPPFNLGNNADFNYKTDYKDSTWLTMLRSRISSSRKMLKDESSFFLRCDHNGNYLVKELLCEEFGLHNFQAEILVSRIRKNVTGQGKISLPLANDSLFLFFNNEDSKFADPYLELKEKRKAYWRRMDDSAGFRNPPERIIFGKTFSPYKSDAHFKYSQKSIDSMINEGRIRLKCKTKKCDFALYSGVWGSCPECGSSDATPQYQVKESNTKILDTNWMDVSGYTSNWGFSTENGEYLLERVIKTTSNIEDIILDFFGGSGTTAAVAHKMNRKWIMAEVGEQLYKIIIPRMKAVLYGEKSGVSKKYSRRGGAFKIIKLESYDDTLNNIRLKALSSDLFESNEHIKNDYMINYMLNMESRKSLLSTDNFKTPFSYTMNITVDSAGAYEEQKIDLVETFSYLIGLTVNHIDAQPERGFVTVTGTLPSGEKTLVLWRDCERIDYEGLNKLCDRLAINPSDSEFDVVYINGDHNIPTVLSQTTEEGGETKTLKLRQIEPEFLERMFAVEDE